MNASIKSTNPQKYYMNIICNLLYYFGIGNFWYEKREETNTQKWLYRIWMVISNTYLFTFAGNLFLANIRSDLDKKEANDASLFSFAFFSISFKVILSYIQRKRIIIVVERVLEGSRSFVDEETDRACVKRFLRLSVTAIGVTFLSLVGYTIDGIKAHISDGIPIRTEVTYYPRPSESGFLVNVLRFFIQLHWWYIVAVMCLIDALCICSLVIVGHKFRTLQIYFERMRNKVEEIIKTKDGNNLAQEFRNDFVEGIKMHEDALWCAKNVQDALGNLYSVQIFETTALLIMSLVKLVTQEKSITFLIASFIYIACLFLLTGAYMLAGGDITYEASQLHTSMFHSGWELVPDARLRTLVVVALQRSQVPVYMFAFGILILSYSNYITVMRSSYSFFAVMY